MSRVRIIEPVLDASGNARVGLTLHLYLADGGTTDATIFSAETGAGTTAQPLTTDANGNFDGWIDEGSYDIVLTGDATRYRRNYLDATREAGLRDVLLAQVFS